MHGDITISFKITMSSYSNHIYCLDYLTKVKENYALYFHTSVSVQKNLQLLFEFLSIDHSGVEIEGNGSV